MLLLLIACQSNAEKETAATAVPVPYIYEGDDLPAASVSAADVEGAVAEGLSVAMSLMAPPVFPAYQAAMAGAENGCPNYYDYDGNLYWYDNCTTNGGSSYSGYSFYTTYEDVDDGAGSIYNGESLSGVAQIETGRGYRFEAGGSAYYYTLDHSKQNDSDADYTMFVSIVQGAFSYDGAEAENTWLSEDLAPDITFYAYYVPDYDGRVVSLDGSVGGLSGSLPYVVFDNLTLFEQGLSTCTREPGGGLSVRGTDGYWYDVIFDGPVEFGEQVDSSLCDGCGRLYFQGEEIGEVCADVSTMLAWEQSPW